MGLKAEQGPATPWGSSEDTALRGERVRRATGLPASRQRVQGTITRASLATSCESQHGGCRWRAWSGSDEASF